MAQALQVPSPFGADPIRDPALSAAARGHAEPRRMLPVRWQFAPSGPQSPAPPRCPWPRPVLRVVPRVPLSMSQDFPSARVPTRSDLCPQAGLGWAPGQKSAPDLRIRGRCSETLPARRSPLVFLPTAAGRPTPDHLLRRCRRLQGSRQAAQAVCWPSLCPSNLREPRGARRGLPYLRS